MHYEFASPFSARTLWQGQSECSGRCGKKPSTVLLQIFINPCLINSDLSHLTKLLIYPGYLLHMRWKTTSSLGLGKHSVILYNMPWHISGSRIFVRKKGDFLIGGCHFHCCIFGTSRTLIRRLIPEAFLAVQWLGVDLAMQGT